MRGRVALARRLLIEYKIASITDDTCARISFGADPNNRLAEQPNTLIYTAELKEDNKVH